MRNFSLGKSKASMYFHHSASSDSSVHLIIYIPKDLLKLMPWYMDIFTLSHHLPFLQTEGSLPQFASFQDLLSTCSESNIVTLIFAKERLRMVLK